MGSFATFLLFLILIFISEIATRLKEINGSLEGIRKAMEVQNGIISEDESESKTETNNDVFEENLEDENK